MNFENAPHAESAYIYACHVTKGHKQACKWERLACERFLQDLESFESGEFEYTFDLKSAERACRFIEKLPHTKGKWAAQRLKFILEPWQCFIVCNLFGWLNAEGFRRFRKAFMLVPRKNGKSNLMAAIGMYMLCMDNEFGAEIYSGATTERQAWYVFKPAHLMCSNTPLLTDHFGIEVNAKNLNILKDASKFEPLVGDPGDGGNPSCAIIDEYHEHKDDKLVETMVTGMGSREHPLLLMITTAGDNHAGPCYTAQMEVQQILENTIKDESMFAVIYGIDKGDNWTSQEALIKANPNYDISVSAAFLQEEQKQAERSPTKQSAFKRKHLNQWVGAAAAWLNMERWNDCKDESLNESDFKDDTCIFSLDLSSKIDLTAFVKVYVRPIENVLHYYAFSKFYLPEDTIFASSNKHYQGWHSGGYITATDGAEIDLNEIEQDILQELNKIQAREIAYDPWHAKQLAQTLETQGALTVEYRPTRANMNEAMRELEGAIESGRFHHDGNPVLTWNAGNVIAKTDYQDNIYPVKDATGDKKIDGLVAVLMGVGRAVHAGAPQEYDVIYA